MRGGIAHFNALLYHELVKRHEVHIITFSRQYPSLFFPGKTQKETSGELLRVPSEPRVDSINPLNWLRVGNEICRREPDVVIFKYWLPFFGPCFGTIARRAKRNGKTKVVCICDNVIPHEKRPGDRMFTRYAFGSVDGFIVQSDAVERDLVSFLPGARYRKVAHPVYTLFGEPTDTDEARRRLNIRRLRVLLFFGYVRPYKGLDALLEAMARLKGRLDVHLLVVGEFYGDYPAYQIKIRELSLQENVTTNAEYVPNDQVGLYFSAADVVVLPYHSATQSGIVQIAYNFDKPVIATNVGGLGEVVLHQKTGLLVPPGNPDALAEAILQFYSEGKEKEYVEHIRVEKKKYTWEAMAVAVEDLVRL